MILKKLRKAANLTQQQLADAVNIDRISIVRYESGARIPPYDRIKLLADFLNVTPARLMGEKEDATLDAEAWEYRIQAQRNPQIRLLFSIAKTASQEDLQKIIQIFKVLKGDLS